MIVKLNEAFFLQLDIVYHLTDETKLGILNFWIEDICYPGKGVNLVLNSLIHSLCSNINEIENLRVDLGNISIEKIDFTDFENNKLVWMDTDELFQFGFSMILGFNEGTERLFYSNDYEKTYSEITLPKHTLVKTLRKLRDVKI